MQQQIRLLTDRQCFVQDAFGVKEVSELSRFYQQPLGKRLLHADKVRREWSFNLRMNSQEVTLLQGVIDCAWLEADGWVLLDYKTDHFTDEDVFVARHQLQLNWYARALKQITGLPVKEMWLYAISRGQAYAVPEMPLP